MKTFRFISFVSPVEEGNLLPEGIVSFPRKWFMPCLDSMQIILYSSSFSSSQSAERNLP